MNVTVVPKNRKNQKIGPIMIQSMETSTARTSFNIAMTASLIQQAEALTGSPSTNIVPPTWLILATSTLLMWRLLPFTHTAANSAKEEIKKISRNIPGVAGYMLMCIIIVMVNTTAMYVSSMMAAPIRTILPSETQQIIGDIRVYAVVLAAIGMEVVLRWGVPRLFWIIRWRLPGIHEISITNTQTLIDYAEKMKTEEIIVITQPGKCLSQQYEIDYVEKLRNQTYLWSNGRRIHICTNEK